MNANRLIEMVLRMVMRRLMRRGISRGIDTMAKRSGPGERQTGVPHTGRDAARRMRALRRFGKL